ncbi:MAG TPA: beta-ketoacyl-[acyl-carrier-protein] synthase family protein [Caulobacteraceae bacterium]|nr:beta-ketoacyl-[acyl-carrier-protein] synthase family protein [Caulobacteraceae bacterium]
MNARRIVVTGLGAISPLGATAPESWAAARDGHGAIKLRRFDPGPHGPETRDTAVALVEGDTVAATEAALGRRIGNSLDPFALYALKACHEALGDAGLIGSPALAARTAVVLGHGFAGIHTLEASYERFYGQKAARMHPMTVPRVMVSAPVSAVSMEFGVKGPVFAVSSACSSSGHAIAQGASLIASGQADAALVGGSEAIATPTCLRAWEGLNAMSPTTCRPFSAGRDGMAIGEGAAALILESLDHARARGAKIVAELAGVGLSSDAFHWTQPSLEGAVTAMGAALDQAGAREASQILISTHGTGTPLNDKNETAAIHAVFDSRAKGHPVIATKSAHGHLIGAATVLQGVIGLIGLGEGLAPPILNYLGPDPDCDLDLVLGAARPIAAELLLLNSFAFGGLNCSLVFRRWEVGA